MFEDKKVNFSKLIHFGFIFINQKYIYEKILHKSKFKLRVTVTNDGKVIAKIIDPKLNEEYILHKVNDATGNFVDNVRYEYEQTLKKISDECFDIFISEQAQKLISYIDEKYHDCLEFLWSKFPRDAIWRRKDNRKWYALLLAISKHKLGIDSDEIVEIIDFRVQPQKLQSLLDNKIFFPGYHMNKKHWCTIILNNSVPTEKIYEFIAQSRLLAI